jgi:hypothetical protein
VTKDRLQLLLEIQADIKEIKAQGLQRENKPILVKNLSAYLVSQGILTETGAAQLIAIKEEWNKDAGKFP